MMKLESEKANSRIWLFCLPSTTFPALPFVPNSFITCRLLLPPGSYCINATFRIGVVAAGFNAMVSAPLPVICI
jgi:hypothetical protein